MNEKIQKLKNWGIKIMPMRECYTVIGSELTWVKIVSCVVDVVTGKTKYVVKLSNGQETEVDGNGACVKTPFYNTKADFEKDTCIAPTDECCVRYLIEKLGLQHQAYHDDSGDYIIPYCWVMGKGEPEKYPVTIKGVKFSNKWNPELVPESDKGVYDVPGRYWNDRDEVLLWNDYKVKESDGSCHIIKGRMNRLVLTDEQKVAVQAVRDAFEAARSLGVKFCWLSDHDMLQAISVNNLSDFKSSWERSELEEFEFVAEDNHVVNDLFCTDIQMYDFWLNCDSALGVSFK